ncbi:MAG: hypothetical protein HQM14_00670 [SAR324 cluster bacterium]|nr:hypothetical protein [SAR324 cluster bacterium]
MNWSDDKKKKIQQESEQYMEAAIDCLETASILLEHEKFNHSCQFSQDAVKALMNCYFTIYEISLPIENQKYMEHFSALNKKNQFVKEGLLQAPQQILSFDSSALKDKSEIQNFDQSFEQFQSLFHKLNHQFNRLLKHELATVEDQELYAKQRKQFRKRLLTASVAAAVILIGLYSWFLSKKPLHIFDDQGQIFWRGSTMADFSEDHQKRFRFKIDGKLKEHRIVLDQPTNINQIRLDPITTEIDKIELDSIQLLDTEGKVLHQFTFEPGSPPWKRINIKSISEPNGVWALRPTTHDPFIISEKFLEQEVKEIKIKMRLSDYLSFAQWLLVP